MFGHYRESIWTELVWLVSLFYCSVAVWPAVAGSTKCILKFLFVTWHRHWYIYIYIYRYVCVCVCVAAVCFWWLCSREKQKEIGRGPGSNPAWKDTILGLLKTCSVPWRMLWKRSQFKTSRRATTRGRTSGNGVLILKDVIFWRILSVCKHIFN